MVTITLYARQQKRHRCIEQSFGLCGRGRGWDDLEEWHWNMYIIICEMNHQFRFDAGYRMLRAGALGWPRGMGWGRRWEVGFRMGNTCIPMEDSCPCMAKPIQYCKVFKKRTKKKQFLYVLSIHPSFSQSLATTVFFFYCLHAAAAAAKSLQSCLTPCDPIDGSPSGSTVPGILQARTLEWVAISSSNAWKWKVKVKSLSRVQL